MAQYRPSAAAQADLIEILAWTHDQFGESARLRYEQFIVAALRDIAAQPDRVGSADPAGSCTRRWNWSATLVPKMLGVQVIHD